MLAAGASAAQLTVDIEGLEDPLREAARARLSLAEYAGREVTPAEIRVLFDKADEEIREALEPFGYYNATVRGDLERQAQGRYNARLRVEIGEPVTVREVRVQVGGEGGEIPSVRAAVESFAPKRGERLEHQIYDSSKAAIENALRSTGFLDARAVEHRVTVRPASASADINLLFDSGPRYRFGEVRFSGDVPFPERFLQGHVPWRPHAYYSTEAILDLQQRLTDADYFATVSVQPALEDIRASMVPVDVMLALDERNVYSGELYYSTDFGGGIRVGAERRWLNGRGHKADADLEYSQRLQEFATSYRIPRPGLQQRDFNFGAAYRDEETDVSRSRGARLMAGESRKRWRGFARTLCLQYLRGDFEIAEELRHSTLLYAEAVLGRRRLDDQLFPRRGYAVDFGVRLSAEALLSDTDLAQAWTIVTWLSPQGDDGRFKLRGEAGVMSVGDFAALPPELRFFAGGDRSLRGFDYRSVGEENAAGEVVGGRYLAVASAEYEHYFLPKWGAAIFTDAGDAFTDDFGINVSAGVGLRWRSPLGAVRLDIAKPLVTDLTDSWRVHLLIGPDL